LFYIWGVKKGIVVLLVVWWAVSTAQVSEVWVEYPMAMSLARDMILDIERNVYVTGRIDSTPTISDIMTIKYDNDGNQIWLKVHEDSLQSIGEANAIGLDTLGNVYVTGFNADSAGFWDVMTIKYDSSGNELWAKKFNGSANAHDKGLDIAVSKAGNVYITGYVNGAGSTQDIIIIKYDTDGNQMWVHQINGLLNSNDNGKVITLDLEENIIVACDTKDSTNVKPILIAKYDSIGNNLWTKKYYGPAGGGGIAMSAGTDREGNIYITGAVATSGWQDLLICKYDSAGNFIWDYSFNGIGNQYEMGHAIKIDSNKNVYAGGVSHSGYPANLDYTTIKLDSSGNEKWVKIFNGPYDFDDYAKDLTLDNSGNIYITGQSYYNSGFWPGYATIKYDSAGNFKWIVWDTTDGYACKIITDNYNNIYVTGVNARNSSFQHFTTIKYYDNPTLIEPNMYSDISFFLIPNPVPSNSPLTFTYPSTSAKKEIIIYSIHGKEIARYALPQWSSTQTVKLPQMAGGVYVARMAGEGVSALVKFVVE
jgi:hypothetical protein